MAITGAIAIQSAQRILIAQIDDEIREVRTRLHHAHVDPIDLASIDAFTARPGDRPEAIDAAVIVLDPKGNVRQIRPSGYFDKPDPLPDIESAKRSIRSGGISTVPSLDGSIDYRVVGLDRPGGGQGVWAVPLHPVRYVVNRILTAVVLAAILIAVAGGGFIWWMVRRELRPVDQMVATANAFASGDYSGRIESVARRTELGQLGAAFNDMAERIELAFQKEQDANRRLNQFVADASHELRTPVAAIGGYSELFHQGALQDQASLDHAMRRISIESARMRRMVEDLLLLAQLDRERTPNRRDFDLMVLVRDAAADSQAINFAFPVTVSGPDSVPVRIDFELTTQVVANLLANVRAHTPPATTAEISVTQYGGQVTVEVTDDGPGFPESALGRVFERFFRAQGGAAMEGGAGLGLSIVAAIVAAHGGTVHAGNVDGRGARVTVTLPTGI